MPRTRPRRTVEEIAASVRSMRVTRDSWLANVRAENRRRSAAHEADVRRKTECVAMVVAVLRAEALLRSQPDAAAWLAMLERERRLALEGRRMSFGIWNKDGSITKIDDAAHAVRIVGEMICICGYRMTGHEKRGHGRPSWTQGAGSRPVCSPTCRKRWLEEDRERRLARGEK